MTSKKRFNSSLNLCQMNLLILDGYPYEVHRVETQDGYLLKVHRVLPRLSKETKGPVLLVHGIFGTAADWLLSGQNMALGKTEFCFQKLY